MTSLMATHSSDIGEPGWHQFFPGTLHIRVVHGSDGPAGRVGSGHDFAGFRRVGSGQHFRFIISFLDYLLVPESIRIFE